LSFIAAAVHFLQAVTCAILWAGNGSPVLAAFGLDAIVGAAGALRLGLGIRAAGDIPPHRAGRALGYGYAAAALLTLAIAVPPLWRGARPPISPAGIVLGALSMLVIPIVGSYMKSLAVELRSQPFRSAAVFTFGNSYLSLVLLTALLLNAGMDFGWGDAAGALAMIPFMAHKSVQIFIEEERPKFIDDIDVRE
jgi:divalent metal cation (Fe/Co/Zn/Cd) transporter